MCARPWAGSGESCPLLPGKPHHSVRKPIRLTGETVVSRRFLIPEIHRPALAATARSALAEQRDAPLPLRALAGSLHNAGRPTAHPLVGAASACCAIATEHRRATRHLGSLLQVLAQLRRCVTPDGLRACLFDVRPRRNRAELAHHRCRSCREDTFCSSAVLDFPRYGAHILPLRTGLRHGISNRSGVHFWHIAGRVGDGRGSDQGGADRV